MSNGKVISQNNEKNGKLSRFSPKINFFSTKEKFYVPTLKTKVIDITKIFKTKKDLQHYLISIDHQTTLNKKKSIKSDSPFKRIFRIIRVPESKFLDILFII